MEEITKVMQLIDANSDSLKEGNYLEMCNAIKSLYEKIPKPPVVELTVPIQQQVPPPFAPVIPSQQGVDPSILREWNKNTNDIITIQAYIRDLEKWLKSFKHRKNITEFVRTEAVTMKARELGIVLDDNTIEELRAAGVEIPNSHEFYKSYLDQKNYYNELSRAEVTQDLLDNRMELDTIRVRQRWLVQTYNL